MCLGGFASPIVSINSVNDGPCAWNAWSGDLWSLRSVYFRNALVELLKEQKRKHCTKQEERVAENDIVKLRNTKGQSSHLAAVTAAHLPLFRRAGPMLKDGPPGPVHTAARTRQQSHASSWAAERRVRASSSTAAHGLGP